MNPEYHFQMEARYPALSVVDVPQVIAECTESWFNQTLCQVNDSVVRLGIICGEFHWHKHDETDEFFWVLQGALLIDVEGGASVTLGPGQGYVVPSGVVHRTRAPEQTVMLMVEKDSIDPEGVRVAGEASSPPADTT